MIVKTETQKIQVKGGEVFVKTWSPELLKSSTPVVLLHDSLGCVELWREFPEQLCQSLQRKIIAYDRLGFGKSSERLEKASKNFITEEAEIYLPEILKSLNIFEVDLFGHSVGGAMAIAFAASNKNCKSVITESSQAFVEDRTLQGIKTAQENFKDPKQLARLEKYHGSKTKWVLNAWIDVWTSEEFANWGLASLLKKLTCPVLAIHGDNDEFGSTVFPKMISSLSGGKAQMHIIQNCGHVPHREKPEEIMKIVTQFLTGVENG